MPARLSVEPTQAGIHAAMRQHHAPPVFRGLQAWTLQHGLSWDQDHLMPEPICGGCGTPINVWDGEEGCRDCWDCEECCWDNHAGQPHAPEVARCSVNKDGGLVQKCSRFQPRVRLAAHYASVVRCHGCGVQHVSSECGFTVGDCPRCGKRRLAQAGRAA